MTSSRVAPPGRLSISISWAVLLVARGPLPAGVGALAFFAAFGVLVAFAGLALALGGRFADSGAGAVSWASSEDPPSFCSCAKMRFAAVAPSLNFLTGATPVMLFQISTAAAAGGVFWSALRAPAGGEGVGVP